MAGPDPGRAGLSGLKEVLQAALADRYQLEREVGSGGMATVWLAQDLKHDRKVAIKVLRPELGVMVGASRFLAEIRTTANLQHPHLLPLFDSGEVRPEGPNGPPLLFYVMPWVAGESLRARLTRERQLPVEDAVRLTREVAGALDYAHRQGIVHRDVKPENILLHDGRALVADFGIALALSSAGSRLTETGLSVGTPAYMSPEQAMGERDLGPAADVYALGAVAYEMLVGEPPFSGPTAQAIVARVVTEPPRPLRAQRHTVPPHVEAAVLRALEKLPADRFASAAQFADALANPSGEVARAPRERTPSRRALLAGAGGLALGALLGLLLGRGARPAPEPARPPVRYLVTGSDSAPLADTPPWPAAISPDGGAVVYSVHIGEQIILHLRTSDQVDGHALPSTGVPFQPVFSPDGRSIAFEADEREKVLRLDTGRVTDVAPGGAANGADWLGDDLLVIGSTGTRHGLTRVPVAGGEPEQFTHPDSSRGEQDHYWPVVSADRHLVAFAIWYGGLSSSELATTTDDGRVARLGIRGVRPLAILDDHLVYLQADGAVLAVRLAKGGSAAEGRPVPVHAPVSVDARFNGNSGVFVSRGGAVVTSRRWASSRLEWMARDGSRRAVTQEGRNFLAPRLSPDGRYVAALVGEGGKQEIWVADVASGALSRLTSVQNALSLQWTRDSRRVVFITPTDSGSALWAQAVGSAAPPVRLVELPLATDAALAPDERTALVTLTSANNQWELREVPLDPQAPTHVLERSPGLEFAPAISPDGRWAAHVADQSGRFEVYVRSYPDPTRKVQVSAGGGSAPVWSADGRRLFYIAGDAVVAVTLELGEDVRVRSRDTVFARVENAEYERSRPNFDVSPDGTRLLVPKLQAQRFELVVEPDWRQEFLARVRAAR